MSTTGVRKVVGVLLLALAFGVAAGVLKGNSSGLRGEVGNLSAPWLLVGLLPGLAARAPGRGALLGLVATLLALIGFYAALTLILAGHLGGGGFVSELRVELSANRVYLVAGLLTGPLFGALGGWLRRAHPSATWPVVGGLLVGELLAVALLRGRQLAPPPFYFVWGVDDWRPYVVEALVGLLILGWWLSRVLHRRPSGPS